MGNLFEYAEWVQNEMRQGVNIWWPFTSHQYDEEDYEFYFRQEDE